MKNAVKNKIKHFTQLFTLGHKIDLKRKWHYFPSWSTITTKQDKYLYKYKDDYIRKGLLQTISHNKCLIEFFAWNKFLLASNFDAII